ncbi:MAG: rhodanese-like domain-containing protein [bacterium]|nr:rhodanese-like domain-containing protein [bacterium]
MIRIGQSKHRAAIAAISSALLLLSAVAHASDVGGVSRTPLLSPQAIVERIQAGEKIQFVDVREPQEYAEGHIPGAVNIPEREFAARVDEIDRSALVIPYCNMDFRGFMAVKALRGLGISDVALMQERGINGWRASGLPVAGPETGLTDIDASAQIGEADAEVLLGENFRQRAEPTGVTHRITMTASEWYFEPNDLSVEPGDRLEIELTSTKGNHYFVQPDYEVGVELPEGETRTVSFIADISGDFRFGSCEWDGTDLQVMKGRLRVRSEVNRDDS